MISRLPLKKTIIIAASVMAAASMSYANGGPVATSQVHSTGDSGPVFQHTDVELVSEELLFSPGMDFINVTAVYTIYNSGDHLETSYAFPVYAMVYPEEDWYMNDFVPEDNIEGFSIMQDGTELQSEYSVYSNDQSAVREYGMTLSLLECSYVTELSFQAGDTSVVEVNYSVRAAYEDWESSKEFFPGYEDRRFTYDLSPAAYWGNGRAGTFTFTLDCRELFAMGGTVVETSEGGKVDNRETLPHGSGEFPNGLTAHTVRVMGNQNGRQDSLPGKSQDLAGELHHHRFIHPG